MPDWVPRPTLIPCGVLALAVLGCTLPAARAQEAGLTFEVRGRDTDRGRFTSQVVVATPTGEGVPVTRTATFSDGSIDRHTGRGAWLRNQLEVTLDRERAGIVQSLERGGERTPVQIQRTHADPIRLRLTVDEESGFCVERCTGPSGTSQAHGRLLGASLKEPALQLTTKPGKPLHGVRISISGTLHQAVRQGGTVLVATGRSGLKVIDLAGRRVSASVSLRDATHVAVSGRRAHVTAGDKIHVVDLESWAPVASHDVPASSAAVGFGLNLVAIGERRVAFLGGKPGDVWTADRGAAPNGHDVSGDRIFLPLGNAGGLTSVDTTRRRADETIVIRDVVTHVRVVGSHAYAAGAFEGLVRVDLTTRTLEPIDPSPASDLLRKGDQVYALCKDAILELGDGAVRTRIPLGGDVAEGTSLVDVEPRRVILLVPNVGLVLLDR